MTRTGTKRVLSFAGFFRSLRSNFQLRVAEDFDEGLGRFKSCSYNLREFRGPTMVLVTPGRSRAHLKPARVRVADAGVARRILTEHGDLTEDFEFRHGNFGRSRPASARSGLGPEQRTASTKLATCLNVQAVDPQGLVRRRHIGTRLRKVQSVEDELLDAAAAQARGLLQEARVCTTLKIGPLLAR